MAIKSDKWIKRMAREHGMIDPFEERQVRSGVVSYGLSSYGYDIRVADEFKVFTNINNTLIDPKNFDPRSFVDIKAPTCIVPPNSFALARTIEYFRIPRDVLTVCLGKSTYARCGIIVNVTPFEPEWEGTATLEISNTTPLPAVIYANEGIAHVRNFVWGQEGEVSAAAGGDAATHLGTDAVSRWSPVEAAVSCGFRLYPEDSFQSLQSNNLSNSGRASSAGIAIARSTAPAASVATGLISAVKAPRRRASWTSPAAG